MPTIVFAGTGKFAAQILIGIGRFVKVALVITRPYPPSDPSPVAQVATEYKWPLSSPNKIQLDKDRLKTIDPDVIIVADYGQIIPQEILNLPRKGCLNLHPSLLPKYRGPAPIQQTILNGDTETGTTLMVMDAQMDHGPIIAQSRFDLLGTETAPELERRLAMSSVELLEDSLQPYIKGEIAAREQLHELATTHSYTKKEDGEISDVMPVSTILKKFRAYQPWPGIWTWQTIRDHKKRIKLIEITAGPRLDSAAPGSWLFLNDDLLWRAKDSTLNIKKIQVEGGKILSSREFFIGYPSLFGK